MFAGQHPAHDVAPGPVGKRVEQGVRPVLDIHGHRDKYTTNRLYVVKPSRGTRERRRSPELPRRCGAR